VNLAMLIFNGLFWQRINFQSLLIARNINGQLLKLLVAIGQLSALITPGQPATDNFQRLVRPIKRTKSTEVIFSK
jgi:hypothetical protein